MYPAVVEVNLHAINPVHLVLLVSLGDTVQNVFHIHVRLQFDFVFGDEIGGILQADFGATLLAFSHIAEEQRNANKGVAAVVQGGINYTAVAFSTNYGVGFFHLGHHIHLTDSRGIVVHTILAAYIAQGSGRRQVGNGISFFILKDIIGYRHQSVFLHKHLSVVLDNGQTVHIRIHHKANVVRVTLHLVGDFVQVFRNGFGVVRENAGRLAIQEFHLVYSQFLEQRFQGDTTGGVHTVHNDRKIGFGDGFGIHQRQFHDGIHMVFDGMVIEGIAA